MGTKGISTQNRGSWRVTVTATGLDTDTCCQQWASQGLSFIIHPGNKCHRSWSLHPSWDSAAQALSLLL